MSINVGKSDWKVNGSILTLQKYFLSEKFHNLYFFSSKNFLTTNLLNEDFKFFRLNGSPVSVTQPVALKNIETINAVPDNPIEPAQRGQHVYTSRTGQ